jgi:hypothetical protein
MLKIIKRLAQGNRKKQHPPPARTIPQPPENQTTPNTKEPTLEELRAQETRRRSFFDNLSPSQKDKHKRIITQTITCFMEDAEAMGTPMVKVPLDENTTLLSNRILWNHREGTYQDFSHPLLHQDLQKEIQKRGWTLLENGRLLNPKGQTVPWKYPT